MWFFLPRGSWDWTQVIRFGSKHPYQLTHLFCLAVCLGPVSGHSRQLSEVAVCSLLGCVLPIAVNASTREQVADSGSRKCGCKSLVSLYNHPLLFSGQCYMQWCREVQALVTIAARWSGCALTVIVECVERLEEKALHQDSRSGAPMSFGGCSSLNTVIKYAFQEKSEQIWVVLGDVF